MDSQRSYSYNNDRYNERKYNENIAEQRRKQIFSLLISSAVIALVALATSFVVWIKSIISSSYGTFLPNRWRITSLVAMGLLTLALITSTISLCMHPDADKEKSEIVAFFIPIVVFSSIFVITASLSIAKVISPEAILICDKLLTWSPLILLGAIIVAVISMLATAVVKESIEKKEDRLFIIIAIAVIAPPLIINFAVWIKSMTAYSTLLSNSWRITSIVGIGIGMILTILSMVSCLYIHYETQCNGNKIGVMLANHKLEKLAIGIFFAPILAFSTAFIITASLSIAQVLSPEATLICDKLLTWSPLMLLGAALLSCLSVFLIKILDSHLHRSDAINVKVANNNPNSSVSDNDIRVVNNSELNAVSS